MWLVTALALVAALCFASVTIGSRDVGWADITAALAGSSENMSQAAVLKRIPRTFMALLAGAALGMAGAVMQGVTRNPLADPGILAVNSGAALAVVIGIAWFGIALSYTYVWTAVVGAALAALFVYGIGSLGPGGASPLKLALAGTVTSIALASFINAVVLGRNDIAGGVRSWMVGGVGGMTFDRVWLVLPFIVLGVVICLVSARSLNALALGEEVAAGLGENVAVARAVSSLGAVILCGAVTSVCGPIGFVGLAVPHVCRLLVGVDHRWLLPFSALGGAALLIGADVIGRVIARPTELDVGVLTALVGAPVFIWIARQRKIKEL
ncbi:MAG: iron ABC transporter permease [Trueperaceae bacterium]|nr:iron ABC transporter permease [Trueperaceae bacterium]